MTFVSQKFKPPKNTDFKSWEVVKTIIKNGFIFHSIYEKRDDDLLYKVTYPKNKIQIREFIEKYKYQLISDKKVGHNSANS